MKRLWSEIIAIVIVFSLILLRNDMIASLGIVRFSIISTVLFFFLLLLFLNIGLICRQIFSAVLGIGTPFLCVFPFVFIFDNRFSIRRCTSLKMFLQYPASYKVVLSFVQKENTGLILRYRLAILFSLIEKLFLCLITLIWGIMSFDILVIILSILMFIFTVDFSFTEQDGLWGEYIVFKNLKSQDSSFFDTYTCTQLTLYFLEDNALLTLFTNTMWNRIKENTPHNILADILYHLFLGNLNTEPSLVCDEFYSDVHRLILPWINDISIASIQWWFLSVYLLWAKASCKEDVLQDVVNALKAEKQKSRISIDSINTLRMDAFDALLALSQTSDLNHEKLSNRRYKMVYRSFFCEIIGSYYEIFQRFQQKEMH